MGSIDQIDEHLTRGSVLSLAGGESWPEAVREYEKALALKPDGERLIRVQWELGEAYTRLMPNGLSPGAIVKRRNSNDHFNCKNQPSCLTNSAEVSISLIHCSEWVHVVSTSGIFLSHEISQIHRVLKRRSHTLHAS